MTLDSALHKPWVELNATERHFNLLEALRGMAAPRLLGGARPLGARLDEPSRLEYARVLGVDSGSRPYTQAGCRFAKGKRAA